MAALTWTTIFVFLTLMPQFAATEGQNSFITVRPGDGVTFPCNTETKHQDECVRVTWSHFGSKHPGGAVELFVFGKISEELKAESDRFSLASCSLVIKKVTAEDAGVYICQQPEKKTHQVYLSVVNMTEHKDKDKVMLNCSVSKHGECFHSVKWLYEGKDRRYKTTSPSDCSASITVLKSDKPKYLQLFKCEMTDFNGQQFTFSPQPSGETPEFVTSVPGKDPKAETESTSPTSATTSLTKMSSAKPAVRKTSPTERTDTTTKPTFADWWWFAVLAVVVAAVFVAAFLGWKRTKRSRLQADVTTADPEDAVPYASVSYTNKRAPARGGDGDEDAAVTYSTVKAASTDPSSFYSTVNNSNT